MSTRWQRPEHLWRRYLVALVVVFLLLAGSHSANRLVLDGAKEQATALNVAGRQRMLSQRILYLSTQIDRSQADDTARAELLRTVASFERGHRSLTSGGDLGLSAKNAVRRRATYDTLVVGGRSITSLVDQFIADARSVAQSGPGGGPAGRRLHAVGANDLLTGLDASVRAFEGASHAKAAGIERIAAWSFYAAIFVLMLEALFIFLPSQRLVTAALSQLKLSNLGEQKARARAEEALAVRTQFMANMSHEIRTPMNGVLGMAQVLAATDLDDRQRQLTEVISSSGNALLSVINDVLDFSKLDAGKMTLAPHPFDLRKTITEVAMLMQARVLDSGVELIVRYQAGLPTSFLGDEGRLRQVVSNLVGNAVKFTPAGHVVLDVSGIVDGPNCALTIRVQDTGIGIDSATLPRVFEKFEQADDTGSRAYQGTGLGLTISRDLTELMGGTITAHSVLGEGSVFTVGISFPLDEARPMAAEAVRDLPQGARLLAVDDNDVNRMVISELTTAWGLSCVACEGVDDALAALREAHDRKAPFDVVVTDFHMPGRDGAALIDEMSGDARIAAIPVVVLSSIDVDPKRHADVVARSAAWVQKPIRPVLLSDVLWRVLRDEPVEDALQLPAPGGVDEPSPTPEVASSQQRAKPRGQRPVILLAEDNVVNVMVATSMIGEDEFDIVVADDGAAAVDAFAAHRPDLVLMDISMPVLDGFAATAKIRSYEDHEGLTRTPIIAVTANTADDDRHACEAGGMDGFLAKPLRRETLLATLEEWLGGTAEPVEAAAPKVVAGSHIGG